MIIHQPELRQFWDSYPYTHHHSSDVAVKFAT